ncbi:MAG TPA: energy transducer TonB, partial [Burkholderiales bacterium]|nr:energy transducer TonB [Burkholderiales bacterium]
PRFNADYLQNPRPPYPSISRRMREEGTVMLRVFVSASGAPDKVELNKSSGFTRLDQSALETVQQRWKFTPARQGDTPTGAWVLIPISFSLEG